MKTTLHLVALLAAITLFVLSCSTTPSGLSREQAMYAAGTNAVGYAHGFTPYVPAPYNGLAEAILGVATAGLAGWNAWQQKHIKELKNGLNGKADKKATS